MQTLLLVSSILLWLMVLFNLLLSLALIRRYNSISAPQNMVPQEWLPVATEAPDFNAPTSDGVTKTLADYVGTGRSTLFVFTAPGCQPCHDLVTSFKTWFLHAREAGVEPVIVSDAGIDETRKWVQKMDIPFDVLAAPRSSNPFFKDYKVTSTPSHYLLNEQGIIQAAGFSGERSPQWVELTSAWSKQSLPA